MHLVNTVDRINGELTILVVIRLQHFLPSPIRRAASLPSARVGAAILLGFFITCFAFGVWTGIVTAVAAVLSLAAIHTYDINGEG